MRKLRVGSRVRIPWGLNGWQTGEIVEEWGDAANHIRVRLDTEEDDEEPVVLLLTVSAVEPA